MLCADSFDNIIHLCALVVRKALSQGLPTAPSGQGLAARAHPTAPAKSRAAGGTGTAPALSSRRLPGDRDGTRPGREVGPWVSLARWGPWAGRAGLWGTGERPCCSVTGAGADGPGELKWGPGP